MRYAVIQTGGTQYQITEGQILAMEKIDGEKGQELNFEKVLLLVDGDNVEIGRPILEGKKVIGQIEEQYKDKKLYIYKYKSKSRYRRKTGHRQLRTKVKIKKIA